MQIVPPNVGVEQAAGRVVRLDRKRVVEFRPPKRWRGKLAKIRTNLPIVERVHREWMLDGSADRALEDSAKVWLARDLQIGRLTASVGWGGRGLLHEHMSEFHVILRELRWQRFCIEMRDAILATLSLTFQRIGELRNERPRLVWDGLATLEEVEKAERKLMAGAPFEIVLAPFQ